MPQVVRKISNGMVEVLFEKPLDVSTGAGAALKEFAEDKDDMTVLLDADGNAEGVQANPKTYVAFLQSMKVSRQTIDLFRSALDDSKKAVRARQREPRRKF